MSLSPEIINYVMLPVLIFATRVADVSMGTIRIIYVSRGMRILSSVLGFFEILIWLFAISQIMKNLNSPLHYIAYAAGFATGNFVGISIERKLAVGNKIIQIVTGKDATELARALKSGGYGVTSVDGQGTIGPVKVIFTVIRQNRVSEVVNIIRKFNPNAFYTVEDIRFVRERGGFPVQASPERTRQKFRFLFRKKK